jgi:predicted Zn-dependent protease
MHEDSECPAARIVAITPDGRPSAAVISLVREDVMQVIWVDRELRVDGEWENELDRIRIVRIIVDSCRIARWANYVPLMLSFVSPEWVADNTTTLAAEWEEVID